MDGTLLRRDGTLSPGNRAAIEDFCAGGGVFTVATGRSALGFERLRPTVPYNAPCVLSNGAVLYDYVQNAVLHADTLSGDVCAFVNDMLSRFPGVGIEFHQVWHKFALHRNRWIEKHLQVVGCEAMDIKAPEEAEPPFVKLLFVDAPELLVSLAADFAVRYGERYQMTFSNPAMAEVQDHGIDKGKGVALLAEWLRISEERVFTAGDERNDLAMLTRFCSFAPANACKEAKAAARYPLPDCEEDAIALMIRQIGGILRGK